MDDSLSVNLNRLDKIFDYERRSGQSIFSGTGACLSSLKQAGPKASNSPRQNPAGVHSHGPASSLKSKGIMERYRLLDRGIEVVATLGVRGAIQLYESDPAAFRDLL
jgi:hypothetical protein